MPCIFQAEREKKQARDTEEVVQYDPNPNHNQARDTEQVVQYGFTER